MKKEMIVVLAILLVNASYGVPVAHGEFVSRGIACVPDCGTGGRAIEMARKGDCLILAMDADPANVAAAKRAAAEEGLLGRNLYVEQGTIDAVPFADNYVDLLDLSSRKSSNLTGDQLREIERVLTPIRGTAVFADKTITKPQLPGSDWWPHKLHGANNNQVSRDTAFRWPPILQFRALPMSYTHSGTALTDQGCHVEINGWPLKNPERAALCGRLFVRNSYNGRLLWKDFIPENVEANMPLYAIAAGKLYLASGTRAEVEMRDLFTGKKLPAVTLGGEDRRVKWLTVEAGTLFALLGSPAETRRPFVFALQPPVFAKHEKEHTLFGTEIVAWDLGDGKMRWRHEEANPIDFRSMTLNDGRLYFYSETKRLVCLDAGDGNLLWENSDRSWMDAVRRPQKVHNHNIRHMSTVTAADGILSLALLEADSQCFFDERTGNLISRIEAGRRGITGQKSFILKGTYYQGGSAIDLRSGERTGQSVPSPAGTAWCGIATYAPGLGVIGHSTLGYKSPCGIGAWVAGGILLYSPTVCGCGSVQGAAGFASGGDVYQRIESEPAHPLVKGEAFGIGSALASPVQESDWPAYRGDSRHRGSSPAAIGSSTRVLWTAIPDHPFEYSVLYNQLLDRLDERPTPPTIVGDRIYVAGSDGQVSARSLADGVARWNFAADGPVFTSPAFSDGRLFIPCADGWVYALDAATGKLAWKRRLAPMDRRIHVFDQLMSTWPVLSLAVEDGVVYAAAGMFLIDGSKAFALQADTGEVVWSRYFPPDIQGSHQMAKERVFGYGGHTAVAGDHVWMAGFHTMPLTLDRQTGELPPLSETFEQMRHSINFRTVFGMQGQDVVVMDDRFVLAGGSHLLENQHLREGKRNRIEYNLYSVDGRGAPDMEKPPPSILKVARIAPACDDTLVVFAAPPPTRLDGKGSVRDNYKMSLSTVGLNVWSKAAFTQEGRTMQAKPLVKAELRFGKPDYTRWTEVFRNLKYDDAMWQKPDLDVSALAMAGNAVLAAHATGYEEPRSWNVAPEQQREARIKYDGWKLTALDRADGKELWSIPLPAEPLRNGIAIAANGTVVLALRDGTLMAVGS